MYIFDGNLAIVVATVTPDLAPGYGRNTVGPPEGNADIVFFGPLDRDVAVVVLEAYGQPIAAVRPRARLALFNTLDVPREATLHLVGYGSTGKVIHEGVISTVLVED